MTRRDYCAACKEMVHDYDVSCDACGVSLCFECATTYDAMSRLCILNARVHVLVDETITIAELEQFCQDVDDDAVNAVLKFDEYDVENIIDAKKLLATFASVSNRDTNLSSSNSKSIIDTLDAFDIGGACLFKCYMCYKKVNVQY